MSTRLLSTVAALALTGGAVLASAAPASAQWRDWRWDYGPGDVAAGIVGGAVAAATSPLWAPGYYDYYPGYTYAPAVVAPGYYAAAPGYAVPGYYNAAPYDNPPPSYYNAAPAQIDYDTLPRSTYAPPAPAYSTTVVQNGSSAMTVASCEARFRSYNPSTGMYTGYDGRQHPCQ